MNELVLDVVTCYENRISLVEELIAGDYYTTVALDARLAEVAGERARLMTGLQEILASNCSLRKKDFNALMERIACEAERMKRELEEERESAREGIKRYLSEQKQLVTRLRQQLLDFACEKVGRDVLGATIASIAAAYQDRGGEMFAALRGFQLRLESFQAEQLELNHKLQRLVERGGSLKLEDLRQLEAARFGQERRLERELRRQEVEKLLAHFNQQRQEKSAARGAS